METTGSPPRLRKRELFRLLGYGDSFQFDVLKTTSADEVMEAVSWLASHEHAYRTLVIDPITIYWESLQRKYSNIFLLRNRGSKGHRFEFYDFQPKDWMTIKAEFKELVRRLIALDMNVVVTARQKVQYADGAFMRPVGQTFDGEKSLPYVFDTVVRLFRDEKGQFMGECSKDRSNRLPTEPFESSYELFSNLLDRQSLERPAQVSALATDEQKKAIQECVDRLGMEPEQVETRLRAYDADSLESLTEHNARVILSKLTAASAAKLQRSNPR